MIGNKLEQSIIEIFQDDLSSTFSINQISKMLEKSYPIINKKSNFLISEGVLRKINIGRSYQCSLNLKNEKARILVAVNEANRRDAFMKKHSASENMIDEISQLSKRFNIRSAVINKKNIIFVISDLSQKKDILETTTLTKDHILSFYDEESFRKKFISDFELQKYHIVLYNADLYVNMISSVADELMTRKILGEKTGKKQ